MKEKKIPSFADPRASHVKLRNRSFSWHPTGSAYSRHDILPLLLVEYGTISHGSLSVIFHDGWNRRVPCAH